LMLLIEKQVAWFSQLGTRHWTESPHI
jgi:hypothetical protein